MDETGASDESIGRPFMLGSLRRRRIHRDRPQARGETAVRSRLESIADRFEDRRRLNRRDVGVHGRHDLSHFFRRAFEAADFQLVCPQSARCRKQRIGIDAAAAHKDLIGRRDQQIEPRRIGRFRNGDSSDGDLSREFWQFCHALRRLLPAMRTLRLSQALRWY